ncbi:hypothetical protein BDZ45DRAFT_739756 [Acephala macrosclerotiorum]|nr:hypothetical protein BDZ45DRAFT_739756 [Acephala macrosclerotiorum]
MENFQSYDSAVAPANARPEYVVFNWRTYTNGATGPTTLIRSGASPFDMVTVIAVEDGGEETDQNPGYVVLDLVVYYRCSGLDPARIVNDPRTQIVVTARQQIDYAQPVVEVGNTFDSQPGQDDEEEGPQKLRGWTWEHHTYLFERLLTGFLQTHRRRPTCAEFDPIAEDLYCNFEGSKVPVGIEFTSAKGPGFGYSNRIRHEFPRRTGKNVHSYANTTMKAEYQKLLRRFLGPEMGKKKPKHSPNLNRDQRKDKSVPRTPRKKKDGDGGGGDGGGGIGSMWNKPL